jgi:hypothetical protein
MLLIGIISILMLNSFVSIYAYDEFYGVEYDDVVDVGFVSHRNGDFVIEYTEEGSLRVVVNTNAINENFVNAILGMKEGEVKPLVTWTVGADLIEYFNVTIYDIVSGDENDNNKAWQIIRPIIITIAVLGGLAGVAYFGIKIRGRLILKGCSSCSNTGASKCAKCGAHYCTNCSSKGCTNCGSRQFVRLKT